MPSVDSTLSSTAAEIAVTSDPLPETTEKVPWSRGVGSVSVAVFLLVIGGILAMMAVDRPVVISNERLAADSPLFELIEYMKIDINHASAAEWQAVPGIGPALAGKIIAEREGGGPFASVDELARVKGIGPRTIENIREYLAVTEESNK